MPASRSAPVEPSKTFVVLEALRTYDDFLSIEDLTHETSLPARGVKTALWWLQKVRAVDAVEVNGRTFWFATGDDNRVRHLDMRKVEDEPRATGTRRRKNPRKPE